MNHSTNDRNAVDNGSGPVLRGNLFDNTNVRDNASVWQGDNHGTVNHTHHHYPTTSQDVYHILLESLRFDRMEARLRNIAKALPDTCEWLCKNEEFEAWIDEHQLSKHRGFLLIKGKPGSGKSTIMKEIVAWTQNVWPNHTTISYFFNARSPSELEKSVLGLYRSLIYQFLRVCSRGRGQFTESFASKVKKGGIVEEWIVTELQNFFLEIVSNEDLPPLTILVDAIDEGNDDDVREMVAFLEQLAYSAKSAGVVIRVCLSSRHHPWIDVRNCQKVTLEEQVEHGRDIRTYINRRLLGESSLQKDRLQRLIHDRSEGIFLWVVLVVSRLNKLYAQGKTVATMTQVLDTIPQGLSDVFADMLTHGEGDEHECINLFRWVLYSIRSLRPIELYTALHIGSSTNNFETETISEDMIARYITNCSRGLVEFTRSDPPVVQFIHETVRHFFMQSGGLQGDFASGSPISISMKNFQRDDCHLLIAEDCLRYLVNISRNATETPDLLKHPLLDYAATFWWSHIAARAQKCSSTLLALSYDLMMNDIALRIWHDHFLPDYVRAARPLGQQPQPFHFSAYIGFTELVVLMLDRKADVNCRGDKGVNALHLASAQGHIKTVQVLLDRGADVNAQGGKYNTPLQAASKGGNAKIVQMLLENGADVNAQGGTYNTALQAASYEGNVEIVQMLLGNGADVSIRGWPYDSAVGAALVSGHIKIVQQLLDSIGNADIQHEEYRTALHKASRHGHLELLCIVLERGAHIYTANDLDTAMKTAEICHDDNMVKCLSLANSDDPQWLKLKLRMAFMIRDSSKVLAALHEVNEKDIPFHVHSLGLPRYEQVSKTLSRFWSTDGIWQYIHISQLIRDSRRLDVAVDID